MRKSIYGVHCVIQPKSFQGAAYSPNRFCKSDEKCSGLEYDLRSCFPLVLTSFLLESKLRQAALSPYGGTPPQLFCFDRSIQITNYILCLIVVYTKLFFVLLLLSHLPQMPSFQVWRPRHPVPQFRIAIVVFNVLLSREAAFQIPFETHRNSTIIVFRKKHDNLPQIRQLLNVRAKVAPEFVHRRPPGSVLCGLDVL